MKETFEYTNNRGRNVSVPLLGRDKHGVTVQTKSGVKNWYVGSVTGKVQSINVGKSKFVGYAL